MNTFVPDVSTSDLLALEEISDLLKQTVPVSVSALRRWNSWNCVHAERPGTRHRCFVQRRSVGTSRRSLRRSLSATGTDPHLLPSRDAPHFGPGASASRAPECANALSWQFVRVMLVEPTPTAPPGAVGVSEWSPVMVTTLVPHTQTRPTRIRPSQLRFVKAHLFDRPMDAAAVFVDNAPTMVLRIYTFIAAIQHCPPSLRRTRPLHLHPPGRHRRVRALRRRPSPHRRRISAQPPAPSRAPAHTGSQ